MLTLHEAAAAAPDLPLVVEATVSDVSADPPARRESFQARSASSSRSRPPVPPKETMQKRSSMLAQQVHLNPDLLSPASAQQKRRSRLQGPLLNQWTFLKQWVKDSARRARSPNQQKRRDSTAPFMARPMNGPRDPIRRISTGPMEYRNSGHFNRVQMPQRSAVPGRPRMSTTVSTGSTTPTAGVQKRLPSLSPAPLTPHSSFHRRGSAGLRGRKSTSSSVSSVRSLHHVPTHSKASSTSSA
ncbi:MAG: hypothetical protein INR71_16210, partial [Terriglobus roseus]|nr:hypothetical protein [Terriglobus roseus]